MSLGAEELRGLAAVVGADHEAWSDLVRHDHAERTYHRLSADDESEVWLICWSTGHDTGCHDHDGSAGVVFVVEGSVIEERLVVQGDPAERVASAGESFRFSAFDIHRVRHTGSVPAITIHAYSPPLKRVGSYVVEEDGRLARHAMDAEEELKPIEA